MIYNSHYDIDDYYRGRKFYTGSNVENKILCNYCHKPLGNRTCEDTFHSGFRSAREIYLKGLNIPDV